MKAGNVKQSDTYFLMSLSNLANHYHIWHFVILEPGQILQVLYLCFISLSPDWCWTLTCWSMRLDRPLWWCAHGSACSCLCCWCPTPCSTCGHRLSPAVTPGCTVWCSPLCSCSTRPWVWVSCLRMWSWLTVCHLHLASSSSWNR